MTSAGEEVKPADWPPRFTFTADFAVTMIARILEDNANYPDASLKLGAIWDMCDRTATFTRGTHSEGSYIEVKPR